MITELRAEIERLREEIERLHSIARRWTKPEHIKLHAGEMTAQELRTAVAVAKAIAAGMALK